MNKTVASAT